MYIAFGFFDGIQIELCLDEKCTYELVVSAWPSRWEFSVVLHQWGFQHGLGSCTRYPSSNCSECVRYGANPRRIPPSIYWIRIPAFLVHIRRVVRLLCRLGESSGVLRNHPRYIQCPCCLVQKADLKRERDHLLLYYSLSELVFFPKISHHKCKRTHFTLREWLTDCQVQCIKTTMSYSLFTRK